jgi:hypothetical protein
MSWFVVESGCFVMSQDFHVTKTPLLETEVRGVALLREYGKHLLTPYEFKP